MPPPARTDRSPTAARAGAPWVFLRRTNLVEPHAAHRRSQRRGPARAGAEHPLSVAVPCRPDRGAPAKPAGAGRDHRRRDRRLRDDRDRRHHDRSRQAARPADRRELRAVRRSDAWGSTSRSFRSGSRRCCAASFCRPAPRRASTTARARYCSTRATSIGRGDVLRFPSRAGRRPAEPAGARLDRGQELVRARQPAALPRSRPGERQGLSGGRAGAHRPEGKRGARQRSRRDHRAGRGADPALPRGARRAAAVDPARRDRRAGHGRAAAGADAVPRARRRHGGALDAARAHHRGPGAVARRQRRERAPAHQDAGRDPGFHHAARRDRRALGRAARDDQFALQPHRGDRELRGRCRARAEEPAHLAALGGRDAAARQEPGEPRASARGDRARRAPARPADLGRRRRQPARRRAAASGGECRST